MLGIIGTIYINDDGWQIATQISGFVGAGLVGLIFFGIVATNNPERTEYIQIYPSDVIHSSERVYVEFENYKPQNYFTKKQFDNIDSTTIFLLKKEYNYYNNLINDNPKYHNNIDYYLDKKEAKKLLTNK